MRSLFWKIFLWFWSAMVLIGAALVFVVLTTRADPLPEAWRETADGAIAAYATSAVKTWERENESVLTRELRDAGQNNRSVFWLFDAKGRKLGGPPLPPEGSGIPRSGFDGGDDFGGPGGPGGPDRMGGPPNEGFRGERGGDGGGGFRGERGGGHGGERGGFGDGSGRRFRPPPPRPLFRLPWMPPPPRLDQAHLQELGAAAAEKGETLFELAGQDVLVVRQCYGTKGRQYLFAGMMPQPRFGRAIADSTTQVSGALVVLGVSCLVCLGLVRFLTGPVVVLREATRRLAAGDLEARTNAAAGKRRDELADLGRDFDAMADRIQTLVQSERQLLGDISHELRSPLSRLSMALALARRTAEGAGNEVSEQMRSSLDRIGRETSRLDGLIAQLLELVRLESGDDYAQRQLVDLETITSEIVADAAFEAQEHERAIALVSSEPLRLHGISNLLHSAIENVVRNALRHTPPGTRVEVSLTRLSAAGEVPPQAVLRVRDYGPGVPEAALEHLFRPFYRVESARDRNSGGVGLGLSITERAIRAHQGTATARNAPGGGLEVTLALPVE